MGRLVFCDVDEFVLLGKGLLLAQLLNHQGHPGAMMYLGRFSLFAEDNHTSGAPDGSFQVGAAALSVYKVFGCDIQGSGKSIVIPEGLIAMHVHAGHLRKGRWDLVPASEAHFARLINLWQVRTRSIGTRMNKTQPNSDLKCISIT